MTARKHLPDVRKVCVGCGWAFVTHLSYKIRCEQRCGERRGGGEGGEVPLIRKMPPLSSLFMNPADRRQRK